MKRKKIRTPTAVELEFLQVIWEEGEVSTELVLDSLRQKGRELSDGSVRKILSILVEKGFATRRKQGRGFLYRAVAPEAETRRSMVADLLKRAFGGSTALMLASLLNSRSIRKKDVAEIRKLIEKRKGETGK